MKKAKLIIIFLLIFFVAQPSVLYADTVGTDAGVTDPTVPEQTVVEQTKPKKVVAEAEVVSAGDLLISSTILRNSKSKGKYNFNYIFKYVDDYVKEADYAVINLETSIAGSKRKYAGFPKFNTPAVVVDAAKKAGFDMFLTASNHSYDLGSSALKYRISYLEKKKVDYIGTRKKASQDLHKVVEVNGIKIGMLNYTQEVWSSTSSRTVLNQFQSRWYKPVVVGKSGKKLIATYSQKKLDAFYKTMKKDIEALRQDGAEVIVAYPHWGKEYSTKIRERENTIAQKMCDLGVDVIIGGHPHVVEPTKVYTSKESGKTTICLHSMGNFVSSMGPHQRNKKNAKYTTDGVLFKYEVKKYSDGTVAVTSADYLPLYVKCKTGKKYTVIPLDKDKSWKKYGIKNYSSKGEGYKSYKRTQKLVEKGIKKFNTKQKKVLESNTDTSL